MADPIMQEDVLVNFMVGDEKVVGMAKRLAENINGVRSASEQMVNGHHFAKIADEVLHLGKVTEALSYTKMLDNAVLATNDIMKNMKAIGVSANMTSKQFDELNAGIIDAAVSTGAEFGNIAASAKDLYGSTGLKEGLGQSILDASKLAMVFDASADSFAKFSASMIQFSDGTVTADDVMHSFDKVTGLTGKRMDDLLETVTDISKTMRLAVGSGQQFGTSMKAITTFTAQISAKMTEAGIGSAGIQELLKGVMDPNKWQEISQKMPGISAHLLGISKAMSTGDTEALAQHLQSAGAATARLGKHMSAAMRVGLGMDLPLAEEMEKLNPQDFAKKIGATNDVLEHFNGMAQDLETSWKKFSNALSKGLMPVLTVFGGILSYIIDKTVSAMDYLGPIGGQFLSWGIVVTGVMLSVLAATKLFSRGAIKAVSEAAAEGGRGIGKAAGSVVGGFMEAIGKAAASIARFAVPMLTISAALLVFAAAVYVLAQALKVLDGVDMGHAAIGMLLVAGAFAVFAAMSVLLAPVAPALIVVGLSFLIFAASVYVMAAASTILVASAMAMGEIPWSVLAGGMLELAPALLALFLAAAPWASPVGWLVSAGLALLGTSLDGVAQSAQMLGIGSLNAAKGLKGITDTADKISNLSGMDFSGLEKLGNAVVAYNKQVSGVNVANIKKIAEAMHAYDIPVQAKVSAQLVGHDTANKSLQEAMDSAGHSMRVSGGDVVSTIVSKVDDAKQAIGNDIKISTKTGAEMALADHTAATSEHQKNVEVLLADIRDGIDRINGGPGSKQVAEYNGGTPAWRPETLFSSDGDSF